MDLFSALPAWLLYIIGGAILLLLGMIFFATITRWIVKVPPDKALIVYGAGAKSRVKVLRKVPVERTGESEDPEAKDAYELQEEEVDVNFKIVRGGAVVVIPGLQESKTLDLGLITLDISVQDVLSSQAVPISVDGIAQIKIGGDDTYIATAAEQLLNKGEQGIRHVAQETLMGHLRSIIGLLTVEETYKKRETFSQRVQEVAVEDMAGMGIEIKSFVIKDIDDKEGYIRALGAKEIQEKLKEERIAKAIADREARTREAQERLTAETEEIKTAKTIIEKNEEKELRDVERKKKVAGAEAEKDMDVAQKRALAVAQLQEVEVLAPARAKATSLKIIAEGEKEKLQTEAQGRATARTTEAQANATATTVEATAQAQATRETGEADAAATQARLEAEAAGEKAKLLAEATGKLELAKATASQDQINLKELALRLLIEADTKVGMAKADAMGKMGSNIRIVQFDGGGGNGSHGNALMDTLGSVPEFAAMLNAKTQALTGLNLDEFMARVIKLVQTGEAFSQTETEPASSDETVTEPPTTSDEESEDKGTILVMTSDVPETDQQPPEDEDKKKHKRQRPGSQTS